MSNLKDFNLVIRNQNTQQYLADVLGESKATFVANLTALVSNDKKLQECVPLTLMNAALTSTALKLPLDKNLGYCYVIPYANKRAGITEAQFQMGYKGLVQLAIRSGEYKFINVTDVREGELKGFNRLKGVAEFEWDDTTEREKKHIIGYCAFIELNSGFSKQLYMSLEEVNAHGMRYSQTYSSKNEYVHKNSKWSTDFDAMAKKTVLKLLLSRWGMMSTEMQKAVQADQSVQREEGQYTYVDNEKENAKSKLNDLAEEAIDEVDSEEVVDDDELSNDNEDEKVEQ